MRKSFGQVLRKFRKERGVSQDALAFEAKLERAFVGRLERDEMVPSLTTVFAVAKALNVKPSQLIALMER